MSYEILKWVHLSMIFLILLNLGGACVHLMSGGTTNYSTRKALGMISGVALLLVATTGFLLAKHLYPSEPLHGWVYAKFLVWLYLGGVIALIHRKPKSAGLLLTSILVVASLGAFLAIFKPW